MEWLDKITQGHVTEAIIILALLLVARVLLSLLFASFTKRKGYSDVLTFFVCLIFGIYGFAVTAGLPDKAVREEIDELYDRIEKLSKTNTSHDSMVLPDTGDSRKPSGTTAYAPQGAAETDTSKAVEVIKKYWSAAKKK